jgi:hypothetical protein
VRWVMLDNMMGGQVGLEGSRLAEEAADRQWATAEEGVAARVGGSTASHGYQVN